MTDKFISADPIAWQNALAEFKAARAEFEKFASSDDEAKVDAIQYRVEQAEEAVLAQPAPDIAAVAEKLLIIWEDEVCSEIDNGAGKCMVIGDLRRLDGLSRGWDGGND